MRIVTTPMCEEIVKLAGISDYVVNKHPDEEDGDLAILLSESKVKMDSLPIKLNTSRQVFESIKKVSEIAQNELSDDDIKGFYYVGYVTGDYLDSVVNVTRTDFEYDEKDGQVSAWGISKEDIISTSVNFIKVYLGDYIIDINKKKRKRQARY